MTSEQCRTPLCEVLTVESLVLHLPCLEVEGTALTQQLQELLKLISPIERDRAMTSDEYCSYEVCVSYLR